MPKTLHLTDLYVVGKEVKFTVGDNTVKVWLQKMSPIDHETALRKANAKRAKVLLLKDHKEDSEMRDSLLNDVFDMTPDHESMMAYLVEEKVGRVYKAREAEVAARDHWEKDDLIQGLRDAWVNEMFDRWVDNPEDEEACAVKDKITEFNEEVAKYVEGDRREAQKTFSDYSDEKLRETVLDRVISSKADEEWLKEYRRCEIWLGVRDPKDHSVRHFKSRPQVDEIAIEIVQQLVAEFMNLNVDSVEGKD